MHVILACVLTILGTLWTPDHGFQMEAVNNSQVTVQVSAVRVLYLKPGFVDSGDVPDQSNFLSAQLRVTAVENMDTGARLQSVAPNQHVFLDFAAPFAEDRFLGGGAVCGDES